MSMVAGTAVIYGYNQDALLIKRKTWQNWQKQKKEAVQIDKNKYIL
jgi:hypothetical protein